MSNHSFLACAASRQSVFTGVTCVLALDRDVVDRLTALGREFADLCASVDRVPQQISGLVESFSLLDDSLKLYYAKDLSDVLSSNDGWEPLADGWQPDDARPGPQFEWMTAHVSEDGILWEWFAKHDTVPTRSLILEWDLLPPL